MTRRQVGRAAHQLPGVWWPIAQTALAAGLAWYLAHDLLGHAQPFFAPIAAAVCLWVTNAVRAQLAIEMMLGVALGIGLGTGVHAVAGTDFITVAVAVLLSLGGGIVAGQGFLPLRPMFVNQTTTSAILVLAFPGSGLGTERLFDALIGGILAVIFSLLLFPKNPMTVLCGARSEVLATLCKILDRVDGLAREQARLPSDWIRTDADLLHQRLARLTEARAIAGQLVRVAPRRWPLRGAVSTADRQAAGLALLTSSVLQLARIVAAVHSVGEPLAQPLRAAIGDLTAAGAALATGAPAVVAHHAAAARRHTAGLHSATDTSAQALVAVVIDSCCDELQQLIDLKRP